MNIYKSNIALQSFMKRTLIYLLFLLLLSPMIAQEDDPCCPPQPCHVGGAQAGDFGMGGDELFGGCEISLPHYEDFNTGLPGCWTVFDGGNTADTWMPTSGGVMGHTLDGSEFMYVTNRTAPHTSTLAEDMLTPPFDGTAYGNVFLEFDHYFHGNGNALGQIIVYDGQNVQLVATFNAPIGSWNGPDHQIIDLTPFLVPNMMVGFQFGGPGGAGGGGGPEHWGLDNVGLIGLPTAGNCGVACDPDPFEPNNIPADATPIPIGGFSGKSDTRICNQFDVDWFSFQNPSNKNTLTVKLQDLPEDYDVALFTSSGEHLNSSEHPGLFNELITQSKMPAGDYYIKVFGKGSAAWSNQPYTLIVNAIAPATQIGGVKTSPTLPITIPSQLRTNPEEAFAFKVYPNPARDQISISLHATENSQAQIQVLDMFGRRMISRTAPLNEGNNLLEQDISALASGTYVVNIQHSEQVNSAKIIVIND